MIYVYKIDNGTEVYISKVKDGDTACFMIEEKEMDIRFDGIDTPESRRDKRDPDRTDKCILAGKRVGEFVRTILEGKIVKLIINEDKKDKYGRILARLLLNEIDLSQYLVEIGYAKKYNGGKKEWKSNEFDAILNDELYNINIRNARILFRQEEYNYRPVLIQKFELHSNLEANISNLNDNNYFREKYSIIENNCCLSCIFGCLLCCFN